MASGAGSALINEIAKARDSIKQSLSGMVCENKFFSAYYCTLKIFYLIVLLNLKVKLSKYKISNLCHAVIL